MDGERIQRRLAAILSADVVGYSRLVRRDEEGTLTRVRAIFSEIVEPSVESHDGRVFKTMGDGLLAEFASVVQAVRCAVGIQEAMEKHNSSSASDRRIEFRIGVNLGDVVTEADDLYGDGVNVAARLQALAETGQVWISESAFEQVRDKLDLGFEDRGVHRVKNIDRPIRAFRVTIGRSDTRTRPFSPKRILFGSHLRRIAAAAAVVLMALGAGLSVWRPWHPAGESISMARMAFPLPDKPSIAVLPFSNMSEEASQEYFVDGMTEDLITDLSKISALFVIGRNSVFTYKGKVVKVQQVAEQLGVRYVLQGSVRKAGAQLRINAQLVDAMTGGQLWAERYDGSDADVFDLQDKVTRSIVTALELNLTASEKDQHARKRSENPLAYDAFLRGWEYYRRFTPDDFVKAVPFFEKALEIDPKYGRAHAVLASLYAESFRQGEAWNSKMSPDPINAESVSREQTRIKAARHLREALKNPSSLAYQVSSMARWDFRQFDDAVAEAVKAVSLDPNDPDGHVALAWAMIFNGESKAALAAVERARRLDPQNPGGVYSFLLGLARMGVGEFDLALTALLDAHQRSPDILDINLALAVAYTNLGRDEEARASLELYRATWRNFATNFDGVMGRWPFRKEADIRRFGMALVKAGFGTEDQLKAYIDLLRLGGTLD